MPAKVKEFHRLMEQFRTEWFIYDAKLPFIPNNVEQIKTICRAILALDIKEEDFEDEQKNI